MNEKMTALHQNQT